MAGYRNLNLCAPTQITFLNKFMALVTLKGGSFMGSQAYVGVAYTAHTDVAYASVRCMLKSGNKGSFMEMPWSRENFIYLIYHIVWLSNWC